MSSKFHLMTFGLSILPDTDKQHHTAQDYLDYAREAESKENTTIDVQAVWRTDDEYVEVPWRKWRDAHVQVEAMSGPEQFTAVYRQLLATNCRHRVSPDAPRP